MQNNFVYFGTPYVASDTLALLVERGFVPSLVVTSPDAPSGRGQNLTPCKTKEWALAHSLPVYSPEKLTTEIIAEIASHKAEYGIVVAYGKILPQALIDAFPKGLLNIHYSLLPKYRGASPVESALLHNESHTGITIQKLIYKMDAGDILAQKGVAIEPTDTTHELRPRLIATGAELLADILPTFTEGTLHPVPQDESLATHCGKIKKEEGLLELSGDAQTNWNKYRAYAESPGTYFFMEQGGKQVRVKIKTATFDGTTFTPVRITPEGKNEMNYTDFLK